MDSGRDAIVNASSHSDLNISDDRHAADPIVTGKAVQQPKPQALPSRSGPSAILVSPRQNGNPALKCIKSMPWEYSDIPADYVLGATTCALFLSLKYHRVRPEYIYNRIKGLQGKYNLRILLCLVDIDNHEETLKELTKTSLINNVTIIVCWNAQEAGRYLELYKTYEYAPPTSIKSRQATTYSDRLVEFVTVPRGINKTDAVSLVSNFGSIRTAVNAQAEEIAGIAGWGEKKVERWSRAVREPFRVKKTAKRGQAAGSSHDETSARTVLPREDPANQSPPTSINQIAHAIVAPEAPQDASLAQSHATGVEAAGSNMAGDVSIREAPTPDVAKETSGNSADATNSRKRPVEPEVSEGILAALARLRQD